MNPSPKNNAPVELDRLRTAIDAVDRDLLALLNRRLGYAKQIGQLKARQGAPVRSTQRMPLSICRAFRGLRPVHAVRSGNRVLTRSHGSSVNSCRFIPPTSMPFSWEYRHFNAFSDRA